MARVIAKVNIHESIAEKIEGVEQMVLVATLVEMLGGEVVVSVEQIEEAVKRKEFIVERNDPVDDEDEPSITLRVEGYHQEEIN